MKGACMMASHLRGEPFRLRGGTVHETIEAMPFSLLSGSNELFGTSSSGSTVAHASFYHPVHVQ